MPHLEDGTSVDVVLNPLGVPSRMNVGQILETHLGWACGRSRPPDRRHARQGRRKRCEASTSTLRRQLKASTARPTTPMVAKLSDEGAARTCRQSAARRSDRHPGVRRRQGKRHRRHAGAGRSRPLRARCTLIDGRTGESFDRQVTVGYIYMLKLNHLVDDKIHARSIGPYSLVTQQPLGGKAQFGGQRFGEMEVWALEAYGAAYTLAGNPDREVGRRGRPYQGLRGDRPRRRHVRSRYPGSFNVLVKELRSLA